MTEQHYKITEAARNLGVHHSLLRRWIKTRSPEGASSSNTTVQLKAELKRVKKENASRSGNTLPATKATPARGWLREAASKYPLPLLMYDE